MDGALRFIASDLHFFRVFVTSVRLLDILGQVNHHNARLSRSGNIKGFFDGLRQIIAFADRDRIFTDVSRDSHNVHLLKCVVADQSGGDLPCKTDQGNAVVIGRGDSRHQICGPRPARDQTDAGFSGGTRVTVRGVD